MKLPFNKIIYYLLKLLQEDKCVTISYSYKYGKKSFLVPEKNTKNFMNTMNFVQIMVSSIVAETASFDIVKMISDMTSNHQFS